MAASAAEGADAIVLDSSFLIAWYNARDSHHAAATRGMALVANGKWGRALLLEYVFLEVVTVLVARLGAPSAIEVGRRLLEVDELEFVACSEFFAEAVREFSAQRASTLSLTDAAIAVVARTRAAGRVATFDADFRGLPRITVLPA